MVTMKMMTVRKMSIFGFGYVFASSMTVQSLTTIKWQEKKSSMIKIFKFFVSDHCFKVELGKNHSCSWDLQEDLSTPNYCVS